MTASEYERLAAVAERNGMTVGEWVREVLLERADGRKASVIEETLLGEALALLTILLNPHFTVMKGETITAEGMQAIIDRADAGKAKKAAQRGWKRRLTRNPCRLCKGGTFDLDLKIASRTLKLSARSPAAKSSRQE